MRSRHELLWNTATEIVVLGLSEKKRIPVSGTLENYFEGPEGQAAMRLIKASDLAVLLFTLDSERDVGPAGEYWADANGFFFRPPGHRGTSPDDVRLTYAPLQEAATANEIATDYVVTKLKNALRLQLQRLID